LSTEPASAPRAARATVTAHPLWRLRLARSAARYLAYATCTAGLAASARFAIAPPQAKAPPVARVPSPAPDQAAEGYAQLFARRYLTWEAARPQDSEQQLAPMVGPHLAADDGLTLPGAGEQRVAWSEVVQSRELARGEHVYTVAAQTDNSGLVYLTVTVERQADGRLALVGYPAFVGAPASAPARDRAGLSQVADPALKAVVERALRNYLEASPEELAADLARGARVAVPDVRLALASLQRLEWSADRRSVLAVVQASDARGAAYTLAYELDVAERTGRWEISAIQTDPTS
jgi:hypothetical protein